jgi:hypothetical protein
LTLEISCCNTDSAMWFVPSLPPIQWRLVVEDRTRFERRDDQDYSAATTDGRSRLDSRFRIGWDYSVGKKISGQLRYQYSHTLFWTPALNFSDDNSNLLLGNISINEKVGTWTVGRQVVSKGSRRLVDQSDFGQRNKVFDAVRLKGANYDGMLGKVAMSSNVTDYSKVGMGSVLWDAGETMAFYRFDPNNDVNDWTLDHRYFQTLDKWFYEVEGALQQGESKGQKFRGWFAHARVEYAASPKTTIYTEANVASGGAGHLFDPLYGTGHSPYGLIDVQGLRNMRQLDIGVTHKISKTLTGLISFNGFGLYDPSDGWYNTQGSVNGRAGGKYVDPAGKRGRDVGAEYDVALTWNPNPRNTLALELGVFKPGNFVSSFNAGKSMDGFWGLLSYTVRY